MSHDRQESSPSVSAEAARRSSRAIKTSPRTLPPPAHEIAARRRWAYSLIGKAASPPPPYGSAAWLALPEGSAEKIASVVVAAEAWAVDGDDIPERMRRDLADQHDAEDRLRREQFDATVVPLVTALALRPGIGTTYAERRARELADAMKPRPNDFLGRRRRSAQGPVDAA